MLAMNKKQRRMPAEWEQQTAIQLTWPHAATDWAEMLPEISAVYEQMAAEIMKRQRLIVVTPQPELLPAFVLDNPLVSVVQCATDDTWARDHGFITVVEDADDTQSDRQCTLSDGKCIQASVKLLDFCFNGWGEKFPASNDNQINRHLFDSGILNGTYESHLDFVLEGGSIESDGKGTVFTTAHCLLAPHRNQPLTEHDIELRLKEYLGADRIVFLRHGSLIGDDTDGHIDTLVRICPDDTLLYIKADADHPDLMLMEEELKQLITSTGRPYRLLALPMPEPVVCDGERLPATYANYLVVNGAVLVPTYNQSGNDRQAMATIQQAFPDRQVVGIDCRAVVRQHGSLHCCTMQYYQ